MKNCRKYQTIKAAQKGANWTRGSEIHIWTCFFTVSWTGLKKKCYRLVLSYITCFFTHNSRTPVVYWCATGANWPRVGCESQVRTDQNYWYWQVRALQKLDNGNQPENSDWSISTLHFLVYTDQSCSWLTAETSKM